MPVLTPDLIRLTAVDILQCVCDALNTEAAAGNITCACPCRTCVIVGPPAADNCCEGQLHVWLERMFFHDNFPNQMNTAQVCGTFLAGDFKIQYLTCAPVVHDDGSAPSCPELEGSASDIYTGLYVAMNALSCCLSAARRHRKFVIRDGRPIAPEGGCVGWEIGVTIELHDPLPN